MFCCLQTACTATYVAIQKAFDADGKKCVDKQMITHDKKYHLTIKVFSPKRTSWIQLKETLQNTEYILRYFISYQIKSIN